MTDDNIETVDLKSAPGFSAPHNSGEREPSVMAIQAGADTAMKLTHRTCSSCEHWGRYKQQLDGVSAAECEKLLVQNKSLGMSRLLTTGGHSCSQWDKVKVTQT